MPHGGSHRNWTSTCCAYARSAYSRPVRPADIARVAAQHDREAVESHGKKLHILCDTDSGARGSSQQGGSDDTSSIYCAPG